MRGVFEHPKNSGVWWIHYYADGKRHREKIGRRRVAEEAYIQRRQEIRERRFTPPTAARVSFGDLAALAMESKKQKNAAGTSEMDCYYLNCLGTPSAAKLPPLLDLSRPAAAISAGDVEKILQTLRERGLAAPTANRYRSFLSSVFSFAVRTGRLQENPCKKVPRYKENAPRVRYLLEDEEVRLREVIRRDCPEREAELDLALYSGMRRGGQFHLRRQDVDLKLGKMTVHSKGTTYRIPVNSGARAAIERLAAASEGLGVGLTPNWTGNPEQKDQRTWFEDAVAAAGISDFHFHDLRHTFASRLVMRGVPILDVSKLMGHKTIQMTMRYAHLAPEHLAEASEAIVPKIAIVPPAAKAPRRKNSA
jgi:site-specific recombinase XerD